MRTPRVLQAKYLLERKIFRTIVLAKNGTFYTEYIFPVISTVPEIIK